MEILRDDQVPALPEERTVRQTEWGELFMGLWFGGLAAGLAAAPFGPWDNAIVAWVCWPAAALFALIARLGFRGFRGSRAPECWRLRWMPDGVWLRFRSHRNRDFAPDTPTVLHLTRREVVSVRPWNRVLQALDTDGNWVDTWRQRGLEFELRGVPREPLAEALATEARRRSARGGRFNHEPMTLTAEGRVRLELRRSGPVLDAMKGLYPVLPEHAEPARDPRKMTVLEQQDHILDLLLAGDKVAAVKAVRHFSGCSLTEAKVFVDSLSER